MTAQLSDPVFFARHYIEFGALVWPNGLDFSAGSLYQRLQPAGCGEAGGMASVWLNYLRLLIPSLSRTLADAHDLSAATGSGAVGRVDAFHRARPWSRIIRYFWASRNNGTVHDMSARAWGAIVGIYRLPP